MRKVVPYLSLCRSVGPPPPPPISLSLSLPPPPLSLSLSYVFCNKPLEFTRCGYRRTVCVWGGGGEAGGESEMTTSVCCKKMQAQWCSGGQERKRNTVIGPRRHLSSRGSHLSTAVFVSPGLRPTTPAPHSNSASTIHFATVLLPPSPSTHRYHPQPPSIAKPQFSPCSVLCLLAPVFSPSVCVFSGNEGRGVFLLLRFRHISSSRNPWYC